MCAHVCYKHMCVFPSCAYNRFCWCGNHIITRIYIYIYIYIYICTALLSKSSPGNSPGELLLKKNELLSVQRISTLYDLRTLRSGSSRPRNMCRDPRAIRF